jgi:hypothetical protein
MFVVHDRAESGRRRCGLRWGKRRRNGAEVLAFQVELEL